MNRQATLVETPSHTDTSIITAADAALRYIATMHGAEVPLEPFSAAVTAKALASALYPYKTPHGREADSKMVTAISTAQQQAEPVAVSVPDAAIGKLRMLLAACNRIEEEAEELEGPDGLGMGIAMDYWHEFAEALTTARKALAASQHATPQLSAALADIAAERRRQIEAEGWTPEHDDEHEPRMLAAAGACYALHWLTEGNRPLLSIWPWDSSWWKPSADPRRNLVKAGALIAAEIERLDRAVQKGGA